MLSKKPRKQRKFARDATLHIKRRFLKVHLSNDLKKKYGKRAVRIRKDDTVKIIKGQFKGKTGKVERVDTKKLKVIITGVEIQKKDGTKVKFPVALASLILTDMALEDKRRQKQIKGK